MELREEYHPQGGYPFLVSEHVVVGYIFVPVKGSEGAKESLLVRDTVEIRRRHSVRSHHNSGSL